MKIYKPLIFVSILVFIFSLKTAFAHQPRIMASSYISVETPEVSKAYYGELNGFPHLYTINSPEDFQLYLNLLVPKNSNPSGRYSAVVFLKIGDKRVETARLDSNSENWKEFYESYGRDYYYQGPELKKTLAKGIYEVEVSGMGNSGKYVLAIGEKEEFPPKEIFNALILIPKLKSNFFLESPAGFLFSIFGAVEFTVLILTGMLFAFIFRIFYKEFSKTLNAVSGKNIGSEDRWIRAGIAGTLLVYGLYVWSPLAFFFAGFTLFEAIFSWCGFYALLGKNTCPI